MKTTIVVLYCSEYNGFKQVEVTYTTGTKPGVVYDIKTAKCFHKRHWENTVNLKSLELTNEDLQEIIDKKVNHEYRMFLKKSCGVEISATAKKKITKRQ